MGSKSKTLGDLLTHQLRDLHFAEKHGGKMLAKLAKASTDDALRALLDRAADEAHAGADRLDEVLDALDKKSHSVPCAAMTGLVEEAKELLHDFDGSDALDAGLAAAAAAMMHYGIARAAAAQAWAGQLGHPEAADALAALAAGKSRTLGDLRQVVVFDGIAVPPSALTPKMAALTGLR